MKIFDPLYGEFALSELSATLASAPEVRRLSQIRLLNSMTPTLATLGELRRYAHTLGVLHLYGSWRQVNGASLTKAELDALEVAIILHDVATPPFGHLFEYLLKEELGWDHESAASSTLLQQHVAENSGHQIFVGRTPKVQKLVRRLKVDLDVVVAILQKQHPLHTLIFGTLDFDNIDNVWRMAWALGTKLNTQNAISLAEQIGIGMGGTLRLRSSASELLREWAQIRRSTYDVLVFDHATVASQAVLTKALRLAMRSGLIGPEDWTLTDEQLLARLLTSKETKRMITDDYLGAVPHPLVTLQLPWKNTATFTSIREHLEIAIGQIAANFIGGKALVYVFKERGSFSKRLRWLNDADEVESYGDLSQSLIIYIFSASPTSSFSHKSAMGLVSALCDWADIKPGEILRTFIKGSDVSNELTLPFNF